MSIYISQPLPGEAASVSSERSDFASILLWFVLCWHVRLIIEYLLDYINICLIIEHMLDY